MEPLPPLTSYSHSVKIKASIYVQCEKAAYMLISCNHPRLTWFFFVLLHLNSASIFKFYIPELLLSNLAEAKSRFLGDQRKEHGIEEDVGFGYVKTGLIISLSQFPAHWPVQGESSWVTLSSRALAWLQALPLQLACSFSLLRHSFIY